MISKIKESVKKYKAYKAEKQKQREIMEKTYPADYIYIGQYTDVTTENDLTFDYTHEDAFLVNDKFNPTHAIRLTGENASDTPIELKRDESKIYSSDSFYVEDNNKEYKLWITTCNRPFYPQHMTVSRQYISDRIKHRNQTDIAIAKENALNKLAIDSEFGK